MKQMELQRVQQISQRQGVLLHLACPVTAGHSAPGDCLRGAVRAIQLPSGASPELGPPAADPAIAHQNRAAWVDCLLGCILIPQSCHLHAYDCNCMRTPGAGLRLTWREGLRRCERRHVGHGRVWVRLPGAP
jgi:hypothetical protein